MINDILIVTMWCAFGLFTSQVFFRTMPKFYKEQNIAWHKQNKKQILIEVLLFPILWVMFIIKFIRYIVRKIRGTK